MGAAHFDCSALANEQLVSSIWGSPGLVLSYIKPDWARAVSAGTLPVYFGSVARGLFVARGGSFKSHAAPIAKLAGVAKSMARAVDVDEPSST
eukprot:6075700-Alexandrium_andersonii.AAC.1